MWSFRVLRGGVAALALVFTGCSGSTPAPDAGIEQTSGTGAGGPSSGTSTGTASGSSGSSGGSGGSTGSGGTSTGASGSSSSGTTGRSTSSGGSSSGSTGGTGGTCVALSGDCSLENCCSGLTCDLSTTKCVKLAPDGGTTCQGFGQTCTPFNCCGGFGCATSGPDAGTCVVAVSCGPNPAGGPCTTMANCQPPNVCLASDGGGVCGPALLPPSACLSNGQACSGTESCCGACDAGVCAAKPACALDLAACNTTADCCSNLRCVAGACAPSCGGQSAACSPSNGNADCCQAEGFSCLPTTSDGGLGRCGYAYPSGAGPVTSCGGPCSTSPCVPGAFCLPPTAAGATDPCSAAGLVCDVTYAVCRNPGEGDYCSPGGPACQPIADSTATNLSCLPLPAEFGGVQVCLQPCSTLDPQNGTSDCVDTLMVCTSLGVGLGTACVYDIGADACPSGPLFQPCNSAGIGDGVCVPDNFGTTADGLCYQAATDGGAAGSACNQVGNRQLGGLCDNQSYCIAGVCLPVCNAGALGTPACAPAADGGVAIACLPLFNQTGNASDFGACTPACDFTSATGGGCLTSAEGTPEKCVPQLYLGLPDAPTGFCVEAPAPSAAIAVGQPCGLSPVLADTCVDGALCLNSALTGTGTCAQLCNQVGTVGTPPCAAGLLCNALSEGTVVPTQTGYCGLSDGGI